jgi:hypothetical protein
VFSKGSLISRVCNSYGGSKNLLEKKFKEKIFFLAGLLELKKKSVNYPDSFERIENANY